MRKLILVLAVLVVLPAVANAKKPRVRNKVRTEAVASIEAKFVRDSAYIAGRIEGYNANFSFKTGQMPVLNLFTGEDWPQVFDIADDGTFEVAFPVWYDGLTAMIMGGKYMKFYVEPGKTLDVTFIRAEPQFAGELAEVNTEIAAFERIEIPQKQVTEMRLSPDWENMQDTYRKVMDDNLLKLDEALAAGTISRKSYDILRNVEISEFITDVLAYEVICRSNNPNTPLPAEFYAFLRGIIGRFKGKPVLVDFWGTTCAPCRVNLLRNKEERIEVEAKDDIKLVYITHTSQSPNVAEYEKFIADNAMGNSFRITNDEWNILSQPLQLNGIPRYMLFDAEGRIINFRHDGSVSEFLRE